MGQRDTLESFTLETLPDLDVVTLGALELFSSTPLPQVDFHRFARPLVVGSGNAAITGRLLFDDVDAIFADETNYLDKLEQFPQIDGAFLLSASGSKHAVPIAEMLSKSEIETVLLTNNEEAPAAAYAAQTYVFPKNREPYTYNTSTYMGMLLSKTKEDASLIAAHLINEVGPIIPHDLASYGAFYLILPEAFALMREMFQTKFDELFGPKIVGRIFSYEQTKHAKTVIKREDELFISFGVENEFFGDPAHRLFVPLPSSASYAAMMATAYFVIGAIQKQHHPFYKERIAQYAKETSEAFGSTITPIVE